jgi:hypothetical protein
MSTEKLLAVVDKLRERGLDASLEYPGWVSVEPYVEVETPDDVWHFGTANGDWGGELVSSEGEVKRDSGVHLALESEVEEIAAAIEQAVKA